MPVKCKLCGEEDITKFYVYKGKIHTSHCRKCRTKLILEWHEKRPGYKAKWEKDNPESQKVRAKKYNAKRKKKKYQNLKIAKNRAEISVKSMLSKFDAEISKFFK